MFVITEKVEGMCEDENTHNDNHSCMSDSSRITVFGNPDPNGGKISGGYG